MCYHCESEVSVQDREYIWHYRPRNRYRGSPWFDVDSEEIFEVSLCNHCYNATHNEYGTLIDLFGWDWHDAYDGIHVMLSSDYQENSRNCAQENVP